MLKKIIYITGNNRSGTTVLDFLLGEHSLICSLGELHHFHKYLANDVQKEGAKHKELLCSCGNKLNECAFWVAVEKKLGKPFKELELVLSSRRNVRKDFDLGWLLNKEKILILKNKVTEKLIRRFPFFIDIYFLFVFLGYKKISLNHKMLCEAVCQIALKNYVIDSSKTPHRFKYLAVINKEKLFVIHMVRNPVAVVYSYLKRGRTIESAIKIWVDNEKKINKCLKNISSRQKIFVRYEDLCEHPERTLIFICKKIGINYEKKMQHLSIEGKHHIQGSPSKYKYSGQILYDKKYENYFSAAEISRILKKTLPYSNQYGYTHPNWTNIETI